MASTESPLDFSISPVEEYVKNGVQIFSFINNAVLNLDKKTVESFGEEWEKFSSFDIKQLNKAGNEYFDILPKELLNGESVILDVGCGTGRWSKFLSDKVGFIEAVDPSKAVFSAAALLKGLKNVRISQASVDQLPFSDNSFDLVMSIGVLHHIPDTYGGIEKCVSKVKKGGYFYTYLYYNLAKRSWFYRKLYRLSNLIRLLIIKLPSAIKRIVCDILAIIIYVPFVLLGNVVKYFFGESFRKVPLSYYVGKSFNIIRNDSLDRFGTPLEKRFSKEDIVEMLTKAGLSEIIFSDGVPYWHVVGKKI